MSQQTPQAVHNLLTRMTSTDKDFRFMATNDLMGELQRENIMWDDESETKITTQILALLRDVNGEVQNLAVKCLSYLVGKIKDDRRQLVIQQLCEMLKNQEESLRDIASIALKTVVSEIPVTSCRMIDILNDDLNPNLLQAIGNKTDVNVQLESLDILTELINRIGPQLKNHERMQVELFKQLESDRSAVRKRSMNALSYLLACCSDELFNKTIDQLSQSLINLQVSTDDSISYAKTILQCLATITRMAGHRSKVEQINQLMPVISDLCRVSDDELREYCIQTFEAYVKRCPVNVRNSLPEIIKICLIDVAHDPNYNYDIDNDAMETDAPENDDEDDESAEDYSDDDDLSWKVRRASAKCLEAIMISRGDLANDFIETVAPELVSRFKEREDSVKADIIQTFVALLKQTRGNLSSESLNTLIPTIVNRSAGLLREKSIKIRQIVFRMFTEIIHIQPNALSNHVSLLMPGVLFSLSDKSSTSNMKIDALIFIQELMKTHQPQTFHPLMDKIVPTIITAIDDSFYKISSEALILLSQIVDVVRQMPNFEQTSSTIYEKTLEKMSKTDVDVEIKERAITCMGNIIATFGDVMPKQLPVALDKLYEKLVNETTRLSSIKALIRIASSPIAPALSCIFPKAFAILASFLRKNSRPLRISTLILIENVIERSGVFLDQETAKSLMNVELPDLIQESDLYVSQLTLTTSTTIIRKDVSYHVVTPEKVFHQALVLVQSPLLQGAPLQALLQFFSTLAGSPSGFEQKIIYQKLMELILNDPNVHKQAFNSAAKSIASISINDNTKAMMTVQQLINDSKAHKDNDSIYTLVLLSLGEIGKDVDLGDFPGLMDVLLEAFNSSSEDVKSAGSYALGCAAVGNVNKFLPIILGEIEARNKRQYLILHSLREVISAGKLKELEPVWNLLLKHCECQEEGTRNVVSECLGRLTLINPEVLLARLIQHLNHDYSKKPLARATIVASIKFIISEQPQQIDAILQQYIGNFLNSLQDPDINVRRVALITFNSAAHNKPSLITHLLPQLLPLLYKETLVKQELIREVEMGPFKHHVDDGLDTRKAAFECMYTLLDTCQNYLDILEFLTYVEFGLRDDYDIKMLTYLMLNRLAALCPAAVLQRMDRLIYPIEEVCTCKPKENAVKQECEKQDELKRSALRAFDALKSVPNADRHLALVNFYNNCVSNDKELMKLYRSIHRESVRETNNQHMDVN